MMIFLLKTSKIGAFPWITLLGYQRNGNKAIACGKFTLSFKSIEQIQ